MLNSITGWHAVIWRVNFCFLMFVSLLRLNVAFKHLRSYPDSAFLYHWCFDQCAATQKLHAVDTGHDTPTHHSIQTQGQPVVLSIDVDCQTKKLSDLKPNLKPLWMYRHGFNNKIITKSYAIGRAVGTKNRMESEQTWITSDYVLQL